MSRLYDSLCEKLNGHRYGDYFSSLCPFHDDHNPSFFVHQDRFHCASCGKSGTLEYLNKYLNGRTIKITPNSSVVLPSWRRWEQEYGCLEEIAYHAHGAIKRFPEWMWYFKDRKIDQFFEQGLFGYLDGWALFPVLNPRHKVENIVVRHTKKSGTRYAIKKLEEQKQLLYCPNWSRVQNSDYVYVCYGIVDAWAFEAIEKPCVTGITGKSLNADLLRPLKKDSYLIVPDEWEERDAMYLANSLGWRGKKINVWYPEGTKDPDEIRVKFGNNILMQAIGA